MKYILGICNLIGVIFLGYVMSLCFRHSVAAEADYEAQANKYRTEDAAQVCYVTSLYHYGDWTTTLGDVLVIERGMTPSDGARTHCYNKIGTALSFEETCVSYVMAFGSGVTAAVEPYLIYNNGSKILSAALDLNSGTYIVRKDDGTSTTLNIDTREELMSLYLQLTGGDISAPEERVYDAMCHARTLAINRIIRRAMGLSGYRDQDTIYIATHDNDIPGIRTIENQTVLVLQGTDAFTSSSTTLAGYTKIEKRQLCVVRKNISGNIVNFYCYSDELPPGSTIIALYETKQEAAKHSVGPYYFKR